MHDDHSNAFIFLLMGALLAFVVTPWYLGLPFLLVGFIDWLNTSNKEKDE